jgi:hypothetical protein
VTVYSEIRRDALKHAVDYFGEVVAVVLAYDRDRQLGVPVPEIESFEQAPEPLRASMRRRADDMEARYGPDGREALVEQCGWLRDRLSRVLDVAV